MQSFNVSKELIDVIRLHMESNGEISLLKILHVWVDENGYSCVRYSNGQWFHYDVREKRWW